MLTLLPDTGDLLRLSPQYNAATLVELLGREGAGVVLWLSSPDPEHPARDAFRGAGVAVTDRAPDWAWAEAEHAQLLEFLGQYPQGRERLKRAALAEAELREALLTAPLTPQRVMGEPLLDTLRSYQAETRAALDEGPGTRHAGRRLDLLTESLAGYSGVALVALDDLPGLLERLSQARLPELTGFTPGDRSRLRALTDRAERLEDEDDLEALLSALLREPGDPVTPQAELQYAAAGLYLAVGDLTSARELLESAAHAQLPDGLNLTGLILARLGQVRDALGERALAERVYRAALGLAHLPVVARETAEEGLRAAFTLADTPD